MVETTNPLEKELVVRCFYCRRSYFAHTQRIVCKSCNINVCLECRDHLWKGDPPRCKQVYFLLLRNALRNTHWNSILWVLNHFSFVMAAWLSWRMRGSDAKKMIMFYAANASEALLLISSEALSRIYVKKLWGCWDLAIPRIYLVIKLKIMQ